MKEYRIDIDGLRAVAVLAVIFFHLGLLPNGYLGVDVFFSISGYLITSIVYSSALQNSFSIRNFYLKRLRRIFPIVLLVSLVAILVGSYVMLPYDLKNLSYSVIATNFSVNNIVTLITSSNYWNVVNDYKPLMHTWSLGIEEQFYLLYPFVFTIFSKRGKRMIVPILILLTCLSLALFLFSNNAASKFYLLQYRFYELSAGGLCAIYFINYPKALQYFKNPFILICLSAGLILLLSFKFIPSNDISVIVVTVLTCAVLVYGQSNYNTKSTIYHKVFCNKVITYIGKISFSLYMWHQVVFAYARYTFFEELNLQSILLLLVITFFLSVLSYHLVEQPFRNKILIGNRNLIVILALTFFIVNSIALYIFWLKGNVRNIQELNISVPSLLGRSHIDDDFKFNEEAYLFNKDFSSASKRKVLIIGDSYARDFTNVLREWKHANQIEIRYMDTVDVNQDKRRRIEDSDDIFYATSPPPGIKDQWLKKNIPTSKTMYIIGVKDFGNSNGIHYNLVRGTKNHSAYRSHMKKDILEINTYLKKDWGHQYIDLISLIKDQQSRVIIFTPKGKFISFDTMHFTKDGANYFAQKLSPKLDSILIQSR